MVLYQAPNDGSSLFSYWFRLSHPFPPQYKFFRVIKRCVLISHTRYLCSTSGKLARIISDSRSKHRESKYVVICAFSARNNSRGGVDINEMKNRIKSLHINTVSKQSSMSPSAILL